MAGEPVYSNERRYMYMTEYGVFSACDVSYNSYG